MDSTGFFDAARVPPGRWAVAVSGGADSVALLMLLHGRPGIKLHVVHLDHQTRGGASTEDAEFVAELAAKLGVPATICRRDEIQRGMQSLPKNVSAKYRAVRLELFRQVVEREKLDGVILAHHADDQSETILLRLLRGSGPLGLGGMSVRRQMGGMVVLRPLLEIRRSVLRDFLLRTGQDWREDASNQSEQYARNRVRKLLELRPELFESALALGRAASAYATWIRENSPRLREKFPAIELEGLPGMLARESARRWLRQQGVPVEELRMDVAERLRQMAVDAATPARQLFPGKIMVHRRRGWITRE